VALAGKGDDSATTGTFVGVGEGEGLATVGVDGALVGVAVGVDGALVGVAVLSTDNPARGSWALPCPDCG
jgi:hypothetical protein